MNSMSDDTLKTELRKWLDTQDITSDNIGNIRRRCFVPWDSAWNSLVRDETAARETPNDIWKDPNVKAALKDGRSAEDILVLSCPKCNRWGYYNQGSSFSCRFCKESWYVCSEDEQPAPGIAFMRADDLMTLADTVTETTDEYHNQTQPKTP